MSICRTIVIGFIALTAIACIAADSSNKSTGGNQMDQSIARLTNMNWSNAQFDNVNLSNASYNNINMSNVSFNNINMSDIKVTMVQMGGAKFKDIGVPPHLGDKQRPITFEQSDLNSLLIRKCDMSNASIDSCKLDGMKIDGILVKDLMDAYKNNKNRK
jgi:uncharacterized protein YjbI with pentapeptide repeats